MTYSTIYLFADAQYWRYSVAADAVMPGWPKDIEHEWRRLPDRIGAALNYGNGKAYFFYGKEYRRFDMALDRVDVGPLKIAEEWPGVPEDFIEAAVRIGNGQVCLFHGNTCTRFDMAANRAVAGYPKRIAEDWPGMPDGHIDAAVNYDNGSIYFFRDASYTRFDLATNAVGQPFQPIAAQWHGMPADRRVDAAVEWSDADHAAACIPIYDPSFWNNSGRGIRVDNNCYNYACNQVRRGFANPGRGGSGHDVAMETCADLDAGLRVDGLVRTDPDHPECSGCRHQIMMFKGYRNDFHFYRRDRDGMWSHKVGHEPASNLDSSGKPISDPRTADRAQFTEFCGSYCVDRSALRLA